MAWLAVIVLTLTGHIFLALGLAFWLALVGH